VISMLHDFLTDIKCSDSPQKDARRLHIQGDNSSKDNKNRVVFAYLCWLIMIGWFDDIEFHCLLQGHTHEDIDQLFSTIARIFYTSTIGTTHT